MKAPGEMVMGPLPVVFHCLFWPVCHSDNYHSAQVSYRCATENYTHQQTNTGLRSTHNKQTNKCTIPRTTHNKQTNTVPRSTHNKHTNALYTEKYTQRKTHYMHNFFMHGHIHKDLYTHIKTAVIV